jgi:hypothetical protein
MSAAVRLREDYEARHLRVLAKTSRDADQIRHLLARALHPPEPHQDRPNQVILGLAFIVGLSVGNRSNIRRRSADRFPQGITGKQAALENPLAHPARPLASIRRASSMVIISVIGSTGDGLKPQCSDGGRDVHYWAPPAQNRTCGIPASGSHLGCLTAKRWLGHG